MIVSLHVRCSLNLFDDIFCFYFLVIRIIRDEDGDFVLRSARGS